MKFSHFHRDKAIDSNDVLSLIIYLHDTRVAVSIFNFIFVGRHVLMDLPIAFKWCRMEKKESKIEKHSKILRLNSIENGCGLFFFWNIDSNVNFGVYLISVFRRTSGKNGKFNEKCCNETWLFSLQTRTFFFVNTWQFEQKFRKLMFVALGAAIHAALLQFQCTWRYVMTFGMCSSIMTFFIFKIGKKKLSIENTSKLERIFSLFYLFILIKNGLCSCRPIFFSF